MHQRKVIAPPSRWSFINLSEIFQYRQLLFSLAWRDIKVKYAQTYIGLFWAILHPLITVFVLSFVFQKVANVQTLGTPPLLFTLVGYASWSYFSALTSTASDSIIAAQGMIQKIHFPRLILPLSKALSVFIELLVVFACIFVLMVYYDYPLRSNILWLPIFLAIAICCGLIGGVLISALTVRYRDFRFITPLLLQLGLFITPIAYPSSAVPENYVLLYSLNPMSTVVEGFRWSVLGVGVFPQYLLAAALLVILLLFASLAYFAKIEKIMADII